VQQALQQQGQGQEQEQQPGQPLLVLKKMNQPQKKQWKQTSQLKNLTCVNHEEHL
jgi:hypothetical protein